MNDQTVTLPTKPEKKGKSSWTLTAIIVVSVLPIFAAYFMFFTGLGVPNHTVNAGVILPNAVPLNQLMGDDEFDRIFDQKKWRLLIPLTNKCDEQCEQNLYITRQVHIRLGEKGLRLERIFASIGIDSNFKGIKYIDDLGSGAKVFNVNMESWSEWFKGANSNLDLEAEHFYLLVDQEGNAMMSYTNLQSGNELLKDIKRALKYSIDYQ